MYRSPWSPSTRHSIPRSNSAGSIARAWANLITVSITGTRSPFSSSSMCVRCRCARNESSDLPSLISARLRARLRPNCRATAFLSRPVIRFVPLTRGRRPARSSANFRRAAARVVQVSVKPLSVPLSSHTPPAKSSSYWPSCVLYEPSAICTNGSGSFRVSGRNAFTVRLGGRHPRLFSPRHLTRLLDSGGRSARLNRGQGECRRGLPRHIPPRRGRGSSHSPRARLKAERHPLDSAPLFAQASDERTAAVGGGS
jgi:hypothetical protein